MTKQEYKILRAQYKRVCRELWAQANARAVNEFVFSGATLALFDAYTESLYSFARLMRCKVTQAADMLNINPKEV